MRRQTLFLALTIVILTVVAASPAHAQDFNRVLVYAGGGLGYPQGNLNALFNQSGSFEAGGGYNFTRYFGVGTEYFWQDMPLNDRVLEKLQRPNVRAQQRAWTFNPIVHVPLGPKFGTYVIGGVGWYHRFGEETTPGVGVICDPYWSWWYGCTIGTVDFVTKSRSSNALGENVGVGFTYRIGESPLKIYTEVRYHHASYNHVSTQLIPITFGVRW